MPPKPKSTTLELPSSVATEIADAARKTGRSTAFIVARALAAGRGAPAQNLVPPWMPLVLVSDEDDPASAMATARRATAAELVASWMATRDRFAAWVAREVEAQRAEHADDLDAGLRDAADPATLPARLDALASSEYVRVRALVARHPAAPPEALARLGADSDRVVRHALAARG